MFRLSLISCLGLCLSLIDQANAQDCKASLDFQTLSTNQNYLTTSGRIVDVDLDGALDVVYTSATQAIIYYGNQNAIFSAPVTVALPAPAGQIDFGYINQDQFVDLVITVPSQGKVIIKLGSAVRTFNGATTTLLSSAIAFDQERDLTVVDLNGDGTAEILTSAHKTGENCGVYIRQSNDGFSSLSQSQCLISELGRVVARDIDQDGALELIQSKTAKIYDVDISAAPFTISGTPQQIDLQGAITEIDQVNVFDLGADGDLDLIITGKNAGLIPTMVSIDNPIKFACNDTVDNDADGLIDYPSDLGCGALDDSSELHAQP